MAVKLYLNVLQIVFTSINWQACESLLKLTRQAVGLSEGKQAIKIT